MTLKYKSVKLKNPAKPTEPAKYYARESESGRIDLPELADNIARHSTTVSKTDIQAVVNPNLIEEAKVRFVAGSVLEKEIKNAKFEKAAEPKKETPKPAPGA